MHPRYLIFILISIIAILSVGCSSQTGHPVTPSLSSTADAQSHQLWGLYEIHVIPNNNGSAELVVTRMRSSQLHMNVVGLMESSGPAVSIDPPIKLLNGILDVTIRLKHPYSNLRFTGFDVRGILIGHGSMGGFSESLFYAGPSDMQLINADGHTRLYNPTEYTGSGYVDGKLGKPDAIANFTATLNGYKYFADDLTVDMPVGDMLKIKRGAFTAGESNARHYTIRLGNKGLVFQYAIDANWAKPTDPVTVPGSFDVNKANCPEPYHIDAWMGPGLCGSGGSAKVVVNVYDWQKDVTNVYIESPVLYNGVTGLTGPVDNGDFTTWSGYIHNAKLPSGTNADVLIYARGVDSVSGKTYTDYRLYRYPIVHIPSGGVIITLQDDMAYKTIGIEYEYGGHSYNYGTGNIPPVDYKDHDGAWDFTSIPNQGSAIRMALAKTDPEVAGFAGEFSGYVEYFFKTDMSLSGEPAQVYQAEEHSEGLNKLRLWGIYSTEELADGINAVPLDPPIDFNYPMTKSTHYSVSKKYTIIPFLLTFTVTFERWGLGEGVAFIPLEPGVNGWGWVAQSALETRTFASFSTGGALGQGLLGTGIVYEWIADDGTLYGSITSGNQPGETPNFNESTYEITGSAGTSVLVGVS